MCVCVILFYVRVFGTLKETDRAKNTDIGTDRETKREGRGEGGGMKRQNIDKGGQREKKTTDTKIYRY